MPIYDMRCPNGDGYYLDIICAVADRHEQGCPHCGIHLVIIPTPVPTIGVMPSTHAYEFGQIGRKFETNQEFRNYRRDNPEVRFQGKMEFQRHKDQVRAQCERSARRQGFTDLEDKRSHMKKGASRPS